MVVEGLGSLSVNHLFTRTATQVQSDMRHNYTGHDLFRFTRIAPPRQNLVPKMAHHGVICGEGKAFCIGRISYNIVSWLLEWLRSVYSAGDLNSREPREYHVYVLCNAVVRVHQKSSLFQE